MSRRMSQEESESDLLHRLYDDDCPLIAIVLEEAHRARDCNGPDEFALSWARALSERPRIGGGMEHRVDARLANLGIGWDELATRVSAGATLGRRLCAVGVYGLIEAVDRGFTTDAGFNATDCEVRIMHRLIATLLGKALGVPYTSLLRGGPPRPLFGPDAPQPPGGWRGMADRLNGRDAEADERFFARSDRLRNRRGRL